MKKKLLSILLVVSMLCSIVPTAFAEEPAALEIGTVTELENFRNDVNSGNNYSGKTVKLTADIDLAGIEWTPIGNNTNNFKGYFDGNNHTISNLTVSDSSLDYAGLFGYIRGNGMTSTATPSVKDLKLENVSVTGNYYVGGLAGRAFTCNITNVSVEGTVSGVRYVGGLVGHVYTYFKDCTFTGEASCSFDALGGIAGAGDCRAYDCAVYADITGSNWVGGIVGNGQEGTSAVGCYVEGDVSSDANWYRGVGGIAGVAGHGYASTEFKNNYFNGEVYLCGEKVDSVVVGIVNANSNSDIKGEFKDNSWNPQYYSPDMVACITAEVSHNATAEEWAESAAPAKTKPRNNNLLVLESDFVFVDPDAADFNSNKFSKVVQGDLDNAVANALNYVSLGDSMNNGYGLTGYDRNSGVEDYGNASYTNVFSNWLRIENLQRVNHSQLAMSGMRAEDLHWLLELDYEDAEAIALTEGGWNEDAWYAKFSNGDYWTWNEICTHGRTKATTDAILETGYNDFPSTYAGGYNGDVALIAKYFQEKVFGANIISLGMGNGNFGVFMFGRILESIGFNGTPDDAMLYDIDRALAECDPVMQEEVHLLIDELYAAIEEYVGMPVDDGDDSTTTTLEALANTLIYTSISYVLNYAGSVEAILQLNPNADIILVALMNTFADAQTTASEDITLGDLMNIVYTPLNAFIAALPTYMQATENSVYANANFYYAEADNVECLVEVYESEIETNDIIRDRFIDSIVGYCDHDEPCDDVTVCNDWEPGMVWNLLSSMNLARITLVDVKAYVAAEADYAVSAPEKAMACAVYLAFEESVCNAVAAPVGLNSVLGLGALDPSLFGDILGAVENPDPALVGSKMQMARNAVVKAQVTAALNGQNLGMSVEDFMLAGVNNALQEPLATVYSNIMAGIEANSDAIDAAAAQIAVLLATPTILSNALADNTAVNGLLGLFGRCVVGNGLGAHPSEAGHYALALAVADAYGLEVEGLDGDDHTAKEETEANLVMLMDEAYKMAYAKAVEKGVIDKTELALVAALGAIDVAKGVVTDLTVVDQLAATKTLLLEELDNTTATIKILQELLESGALADRHTAWGEMLALKDELDVHAKTITKLAAELGIVGELALDQLDTAMDYYAGVLSDIADEAYDWVSNGVSEFNEEYAAWVDDVVAAVGKIDKRLEAPVRKYLTETPSEALSIVYAYGKNAADTFAEYVTAAYGEIVDVFTELATYLSSTDIDAIVDAVLADEDVKALISQIEGVKAEIENVLYEMAMKPVSTAKNYQKLLDQARDQLIALQGELVDSVIAAVNTVDPYAGELLSKSVQALKDSVGITALYGAEYGEWFAKAFNSMIGELVLLLLNNTKELGEEAGPVMGELVWTLLTYAGEQAYELGMDVLETIENEVIPYIIKTAKNFGIAAAKAIIEALPYIDEALYDWLYENPDKVIAFFTEYGDEISDLMAEYGEGTLSVLAYIAFTYGNNAVDYIINNPEEALDQLVQWYDEYGYRVWPMVDVYLAELGIYDDIRVALGSLDSMMGALAGKVVDNIDDLIENLKSVVEDLKGQLEDLKAELESKLDEMEDASEDVKAEIEKAIEEIEAAIEAIEKAIAEIEAKIAELVEIAKDINEAVEDIITAIKMIPNDVNAAIEALQAALEKLADAINALKDLVAELNAAIDEVQAVINHVIVALDEVGGIVADVIVVLKDIEYALGEAAETISKIASALQAAYETLIENLHTASNAVLSKCIIGDELNYIALGGATAAGEGYYEAVDAAITEALDLNVTGNAYGDAALTYAGQLEYITVNAEKIAAAELVSYQMDANEVVSALVDAMIALELGMGTYESPDWDEYVDFEAVTSTVAEIEAEVAAMKADLASYLDAETAAAIAEAEANIAGKLAEIADDETIEQMKPYMEQLVYKLVSYAIETAEAIEAIKAINDKAPVLLVGMYNTLDGVVVKMNGEEIDLGEYFDYVVKAVNIYNLVYAVTSGNVTIVDVCKAPVDGFIIPVDDLMVMAAEMQAALDRRDYQTALAIANELYGAYEAMKAGVVTQTTNTEGIEYIAEQIAAVLSVADHDWDAGVVTKAANCTEAGEKLYTCDVCGETKTEAIDIDPSAHAWGSWTQNGQSGHKRVCANNAEHVDTKAHTGSPCSVCGYTTTQGGGGGGGGGSAVTKPVNPFTDIHEDEYWYDAVLWAVEKGITNGITPTTFAPTEPCTRGQMVTFLWRSVGSPAPKTTVCPFTDVDKDAYFYDAVLWAVENGVTKGVTETTFEPYTTCSRAHMVTFICRFADGKPVGDSNDFVDVPENVYYTDTVQWALETGVTNGTTATTFSPNNPCTRGQMVTFLYRHFEK